jgi:hypothetical protein
MVAQGLKGENEPHKILLAIQGILARYSLQSEFAASAEYPIFGIEMNKLLYLPKLTIPTNVQTIISPKSLGIAILNNDRIALLNHIYLVIPK